MNPLSILLVEDDPATVRDFTDYSDTLEDVEIIGIYDSAQAAITGICDLLPHAVILDLELQRGEGSGLDVLQSIQDAGLDSPPFFLITTINTSNAVYDHARSLGAGYILYKRQGGYSEEYAINLLRLMGETIQSFYYGANRAPQTTEPPARREQRIRSRIKAEMLNVGISPKMQGYQYLIDAIELFSQKPQQNITGTIAQKYGKTKTSVDKAMQNAIDKAWVENDIDEILRYFTARVHSEKGVPTIMEFVCYYADKLREMY